ncbi:UNVERIFIED_CONTAM: hypothetical protein PYX00_006137 [Menopon gallinae]|uniref:Intraflagellar transport protein 46 homolog n=1 Tax=Menopon gallinae TaxID=328185 RepID=A0AAW2HVX1_9NEOP
MGDVDTFIKVSRPDGKPSTLGLTVLDEPCTQQSDPAVLQLQLRAIEKQSSPKSMVVKKIDDAEKNGKSIEKWIKAINDLHRTKPPPSIHYTKPMPNIDNLMQEWPQKMDEKLNATPIPSPDLDCDLSTYITVICNIFDIPVYESKIQSLHAFFTLYSTMKNTKGQIINAQNTNSPIP